MTTKEALLMLKLGATVRRSHWGEGAALVSLTNDGKVFVRFSDGHTMRDTAENFLTQKHTDWEVYCPQDNE